MAEGWNVKFQNGFLFLFFITNERKCFLRLVDITMKTYFLSILLARESNVELGRVSVSVVYK